MGCTADAAETAQLVGGDERSFNAAMAPALMGSSRELLTAFVGNVAPGQPLGRRLSLLGAALSDRKGVERSLSMHCEVATMLAVRIGLEPPVVDALSHAYERWDGKGFPGGIAAEEIPFAVRVAVVARDVELARMLGADPYAWLKRRRGHAYDPSVVDTFHRIGADVLSTFADEDDWEQALACEPAPVVEVGDEMLDQVLAALADFTDLQSPWLCGHSRHVARLAEDAGRHAGVDDATCDVLRRAGLAHDVGRVAVASGIWDKPGPLTTPEWERVRLHPYYTERILSRTSSLRPLVAPAASHHERLDGTGYHRALAHDALTDADRILAVADAFAAMTAARPYRPALSEDEAASALESETGRALDERAVGCVLAAAGRRGTPAPRGWPAGLTDREVEVLQLIARGASNRQVAEALVISPKTVGRHVENVYAKLCISSRAAAAVFAMEHGLV